MDKITQCRNLIRPNYFTETIGDKNQSSIYCNGRLTYHTLLNISHNSKRAENNLYNPPVVHTNATFYL